MKCVIGVYISDALPEDDFGLLHIGTPTVSACALLGGTDEGLTDLISGEMAHPELIESEEWDFWSNPDEVVYETHPDISEVSHYAENQVTGELREVEGLPRGGYALVDGWVALKPTKRIIKPKGEPSYSILDSTFVQLASGEKRTVKGAQIEIKHVYQGALVLAEIRLEEEDAEKTTLELLDLHTGESLWEHVEDFWFTRAISEELYWGQNEGVYGVYAFRDGSRVHTCGATMPGSVHNITVDNGVLRAVHDYSSGYYEYDSNTGQEVIKVFEQDSCGWRKTIFGDQLIQHIEDEKQLRIHSISTGSVIADKPFDAKPLFNPRCENLQDRSCYGNAGDVIYRTDYGYAIEGNKRGTLPTSSFRVVLLFDLEELDQDTIEVEHEEFACQHERVVLDDGDAEYRIWFDDAQPTQVLIRHARAMAFDIVQSYGRNYMQERKIDKKWAGVIRIDLRNQTLNEERRKMFERTMVQLRFANDSSFRAGTDFDDRVNYVLEFD